MDDVKQRGRRGALDVAFDAELLLSPNHAGWTYVVWPQSAEFFGTRGLVKVRGTVDGEPFRQLVHGRSATAGTRLPVRAELRSAIGKQAGDTVRVVFEERLG